jgi:ABC-type Zn2+ transport system substrate-binding protein/surface adhesin
MGPDGQVSLKCNPFANIKEPDCLLKWQLLRLDLMTRAYVATIAEYKRIAPLQEKLYRHMSREVDEADEADKWKRPDDEDDDAEDQDKEDGEPGMPPLDDRL